MLEESIPMVPAGKARGGRGMGKTTWATVNYENRAIPLTDGLDGWTVGRDVKVKVKFIDWKGRLGAGVGEKFIALRPFDRLGGVMFGLAGHSRWICCLRKNMRVYIYAEEDRHFAQSCN